MNIPKLYETEATPMEKKTVYEHWVLPACNFHWFIAELDPKQKLAFGYAYLNDKQNAEWGYISIQELESNGAFREESFEPKNFSEAVKEIFKSNGGENKCM